MCVCVRARGWVYIYMYVCVCVYVYRGLPAVAYAHTTLTRPCVLLKSAIFKRT